MAVLPFKRRTNPCSAAPGSWTVEELAELQRLVGALSRIRGARSWHPAITEEGDPQFYLLGAEPEQRCVASVSRLDRFYILEDGEGRVLAERASLADLVNEAGSLFRVRRGLPFTARVALVVCAARSLLNDKLAPLEESFELLAIFV
jgi:hypothetical protein